MNDLYTTDRPVYYWPTCILLTNLYATDNTVYYKLTCILLTDLYTSNSPVYYRLTCIPLTDLYATVQYTTHSSVLFMTDLYFPKGYEQVDHDIHREQQGVVQASLHAIQHLHKDTLHG